MRIVIPPAASPFNIRRQSRARYHHNRTAKPFLWTKPADTMISKDDPPLRCLRYCLQCVGSTPSRVKAPAWTGVGV